MLFKNENESLAVEIAGYELPSGTGEDADWLVLKGTYTADGAITKDRGSYLTAGELRELTAGLKVLAAGIKDEYAGEFQAPYFELTVRRTGEDAFRAGVAFTMLNSPEDWDTAEVALTCDTACLKTWIGELERAEKKCPPRS